MSVTIRRAHRKDAEAILNLITALANFEELTPPDAEARARFAQDGWGEQPRFDAWIAEAGHTPVGYAIAFETYSTFLCRPTLFLEDLFVMPDWRKSGIGYGLFHTVAQEALTRGCGRMEWTCLEWNVHAQRFYEGLGATHLHDWRMYRLTPDSIARLPNPDGGAI